MTQEQVWCVGHPGPNSSSECEKGPTDVKQKKTFTRKTYTEKQIDIIR